MVTSSLRGHRRFRSHHFLPASVDAAMLRFVRHLAGQIAAVSLLTIETAGEHDPIDRTALEAALRALEDFHVVGIERAGGAEFEFLIAHALEVDLLRHALEAHDV